MLSLLLVMSFLTVQPVSFYSYNEAFQEGGGGGYAVATCVYVKAIPHSTFDLVMLKNLLHSHCGTH